MTADGGGGGGGRRPGGSGHSEQGGRTSGAQPKLVEKRALGSCSSLSEQCKSDEEKERVQGCGRRAGAYLPVPHSWHMLAANSGLRASIQQKIALSRSSSQHGNKDDAVVGDAVVGDIVVVGELVGPEVGAAVIQSVPRLVP
jgi:hypothetical protein